MENNKKKPVKKVLVRNVEQKITKKVVVEKEPRKVNSLQSGKYEPGYIRSTKNANHLNSPEFNSTLRLAREMKKTEHLKPRRVKSVNDLKETEKKLIEGMVTKKVNHPHTEVLYKDLINLEISSSEILPRLVVPTTSRETCIKDKEPNLRNFYKPLEKQEYNVVVDPIRFEDSSIKYYNGLQLHRTIKLWDSDNNSLLRI